jgi:hypothetical protein
MFLYSLYTFFYLYLYVITVYSQNTLTTEEVHLLKYIDKENAFQSWQTKWDKLLPTFDLTKFRFHNEKGIDKQFPVKINIESLLGKPLLALLSFSPNGYLAVSASRKVIGYKDEELHIFESDHGTELRLYDFNNNESFRIQYAGHYGPGFNGFGWLNDMLLVAVGSIWQLARNIPADRDSVAPVVMLFDFEKMNVRIFKGEYIEAQTFYQNRPRGLSFETWLMFNYKPLPEK